MRRKYVGSLDPEEIQEFQEWERRAEQQKLFPVVAHGGPVLLGNIPSEVLGLVGEPHKSRYVYCDACGHSRRRDEDSCRFCGN